MNWIGVAYAMGVGGTGGGQGGGGAAAAYVCHLLLLVDSTAAEKTKKASRITWYPETGRSSGNCWWTPRENHRHNRQGSYLGGGRKGEGKSRTWLHFRNGFARDGAGKEVGETGSSVAKGIAFGAAGSNILGTGHFSRSKIYCSRRNLA
jgi:hypothetical protein